MDYIKKKGAVLQAEYLEEWTSKDKKTYHIFGICIKQGTKPEDSDVGKYYSPTKEQTYFKVGEEVEYMYKKNDKEPRDGRIKPFVAEKKNSGSFDKMTIEEYTERKIADTPAFTASYVSKMMTGHTSEDIIKNFGKIADIIYLWQISKLKE